jgi:hypothetical protein
MMDKFIFWFTENRKNIGYTLGALNLVGGLSMLASGQNMNALIQIFVGSVLIFDAWMMP